MPAPKIKLIDGESFSISQPYEPGHVLTEAEAKTLNQTRSENIGNNLRSAVKDAKEARDNPEKPDSTAFDGLIALVAKYDQDYNFSMGGGGGSTRKLDPIEREAKSLATEYIKADLAKKGRTWKQVPEGMTAEAWEEKREAVLEGLMVREDIVKLAKKRVAEKQKISDSVGALLD